ncbi:MAG TPA: c-type cytochrome, partial [Gemmataceae bacterium]|nr:c-type cytochrome [Gemmataceae bacterium]
KESGWAHAGLLLLEGEHVPEELRGSIIMGSIHGCSIKRDVLRRNGSTFTAGHASDFLVSGDKNFRPINLRWGPDGSIYVIDWHDQNPCHQAAPDSWDMTHGRIYKIQRKGIKSQPPPDLSKKSSKQLVELLKNDNPWWYRTALRLLKERGDQAVVPLLQELALKCEKDVHALRGLWGLYAVGGFDEHFADKLLSHQSPWMRVWAIRLVGESSLVSDKMLERLTELARTDPAPEVRSQLASTAQRLVQQDTLPLLHNLMSHKTDARDPCLPLLTWLAYERRLVGNQGAHAARSPEVGWLAEHAPGNELIADQIVPRAMRRLVATTKAENLAAAIAFLGDVTEASVRRRALDGLLLALQDRHIDPPAEWKRVLPLLRQDEDQEVQRLAQRLAVYFRDAQAVRRALAVAQDRDRPGPERVEAIHDLVQARPREAQAPLEEILRHDRALDVRIEACRALAAYEDRELARRVLGGWKDYPPALCSEVIQLLSGRREWARELLNAIGRKTIARTDVSNNAILRIHAFRDQQLNKQIETVWGRVRETPGELNALIDKMRKELHAGRASFECGRKVFENQCAKCHKFEGKGHEVGPNLDGAARDIEYLLINVLDPNRVIGQPYYVRTVVLKNGRVESGLLHAEDDQVITLKGENDVLKTIPKKDIDEIMVQEKSIMPEGLANNMSVQDFRDLIRYVMAHPFLTDVAVTGPFAESDSPKIDRADPLQSEQVKWHRP